MNIPMSISEKHKDVRRRSRKQNIESDLKTRYIDDPVVRRRTALHLAGVTQRELAKRMNVCEQTISREMQGQRISRRIRTRIAQAVRIPYAVLWSDVIKDSRSS